MFEHKPGRSSARILYFAPSEIWPPNTGARLRNLHLAAQLGRRASATYLSFGDHSPQGSEAVPAELREMFERIVTVPRRTGHSAYNLIKGLVGRNPFPVVNYTTREMAVALRRLLDTGFDLIQVEGIHLSGYLPLLRNAVNRPVLVCDWHNVESRLMERYGEREPELLRRLYARVTSLKLASLEKRIIDQFDAHITVTDRDRDYLTAISPRAVCATVENGVDVSFFSKPREVRERGKKLVFVGSMDYHANIDGAQWFVREAWPSIRQRRPDLSLAIVGRDPSPQVRALASGEGIEVTGTVDDVRPYYREAAAAIVPLRVGGGSRLKILEAMAAGVPVVSTSVGAEGLNVVSGKNIIIADSPGEVVEEVTRLCSSDGLARELSAEALDLVRRNHDWSTLGLRLFEVHRGLLAERREHGARTENAECGLAVEARC